MQVRGYVFLSRMRKSKKAFRRLANGMKLDKQNKHMLFYTVNLNSMKILQILDNLDVYTIFYLNMYIHIYNLTQNKMNLFVLSGHGSESFAAFLNEVILQQQKKCGSYHCSCHHNTSRE